jgi:hypothetical protein
MTSADTAARATDELHLGFLWLWDLGWSAGEIGAAYGVSRNVPLCVVWRIHQADPTALKRKPEKAAA